MLGYRKTRYRTNRLQYILIQMFDIFLANEETVKLITASKGIAYAYQVDLTKREEIYQFADRVKKEIGKVYKFKFALLNGTRNLCDPILIFKTGFYFGQ